MHRPFSPFRTLTFSPFRAFRPLFAVALGIVSALGGAAVGQAQAPAGGQTDVLAALLTEVRGLRAAMEQMAAAGPRVQLALGRLQLQEQRVNTLVRRLEAVRTNLSAAQREHDAAASRVRDVEKAREAVDPSERKEAEMVFPHLQRALAQAAGEVQRLLAEESALNVDISGEQARWSDINRRLEELERSLARQ
jgi:chromosome segregation ATPase